MVIMAILYCSPYASLATSNTIERLFCDRSVSRRRQEAPRRFKTLPRGFKMHLIWLQDRLRRSINLDMDSNRTDRKGCSLLMVGASVVFYNRINSPELITLSWRSFFGVLCLCTVAHRSFKHLNGLQRHYVAVGWSGWLQLTPVRGRYRCKMIYFYCGVNVIMILGIKKSTPRATITLGILSLNGCFIWGPFCLIMVCMEMIIHPFSTPRMIWSFEPVAVFDPENPN
jgi:hypothetical protein